LVHALGPAIGKILAQLPKDLPFHFTIYGSAPLQLTLDPTFLSADVDLFSEDEMDLTALISASNLDKTQTAPYLEAGYELSFRTTPRWRRRAITVLRDNVTDDSASAGHFNRQIGQVGPKGPTRVPESDYFDWSSDSA
jgi:hypothetical protein